MISAIIISSISNPKSQPQTPSQVNTVRDGWKVYKSAAYGFTFEYPSGFTVEERVGGFFVITAPGENVPQGGISIDARSQGPFGTYDSALAQIRSSLTISDETGIGDWTVITGVGNEGMTNGIEFKQAVMRYSPGALAVETINVEPYKSIFNDIIASFVVTR